MKEQKLRFSVVIPTYNRPQQLLTCLEALREEFPLWAEVVVVSDGGDMDSFSELGAYEQCLNLRVVHAEHGGPGSARNHGVEAARGQWIAFTDDDCIVQAGWLNAFSRAADHQPIAGLGGRTINGLPDNVYAEAAQMVLDLVELDQISRGYPAFFFASNNVAFPREQLLEIGGFDPDYRTAEDRELCRRWLKNGFELVHVEDALVAHASNLDFRSFWRKFSHYGEGAARFHADPEEGWHNTLIWHCRLPSLTLKYLRKHRPKRPLTMIALLFVWEAANLAGFIRGAFK